MTMCKLVGILAAYACSVAPVWLMYRWAVRDAERSMGPIRAEHEQRMKASRARIAELQCELAKRARSSSDSYGGDDA